VAERFWLVVYVHAEEGRRYKSPPSSHPQSSYHDEFMWLNGRSFVFRNCLYLWHTILPHHTPRPNGRTDTSVRLLINLNSVERTFVLCVKIMKCIHRFCPDHALQEQPSRLLQFGNGNGPWNTAELVDLHKFHGRVQENLQSHSVLGQMIQIHTLRFCFFKIHIASHPS
jgi:hypothetical protein